MMLQQLPQLKLILEIMLLVILYPNNKNIPCFVECKIMGQILIDHALSYALTAIADIPTIYLQQFWKTDRKEITYTVDMFRSTLQLPVETPNNPFIAPATLDYIQPFMKIINYQGEVNKTKISILQIFHAMVNRIHVDYAILLWNVTIRGILIPEEFFTYDICATEEYKEYMKVFVEVDVPTIQPQPVESTQGTIRTPSAHRTPTPTTIAGDVVQKKRKRKQTAGETSLPKPSLKIIFQDDDDDFSNRIELGSHKEHLKTVDDDDENEREKKDDDNDDDVNDDQTDHTLDKTQETCSFKTRNEKMQTPIPLPHRSPRTNLSLDKTISKELTDTVSPLTFNCHYISRSKQNKTYFQQKFVTNRDFEAIQKNVNNVLHDAIPKIASNASNDIIEDNLPKFIVEVVMKERDTFQYTVPALISKEFVDHMKRSLQDQADDPEFDHDDHQEDDAPHEEEKRAKRQNTSKSTKFARGSSSKQPAQISKTYVSERQHQKQEWDIWVEEPVSDVDEVIPEDDSPNIIEEFQNIDKHVPTVYDHEKMEATLRDMMSNQFRNAKEYAYHLEQSMNYMENQILGIESYQIRVNLTAPTLIFPGIKARDPYSIVDKPTTGLIYLNNKEEKRVMYFMEIVKFCDATLERVLKEVKLKIFEIKFWKKPPLLGDLDLDIMKEYER
ncbi:hypothetical protein Tco_0599591 [Tanacetum coccineum]